MRPLSSQRIQQRCTEIDNPQQPPNLVVTPQSNESLSQNHPPGSISFGYPVNENRLPPMPFFFAKQPKPVENEDGFDFESEAEPKEVAK